MIPSELVGNPHLTPTDGLVYAVIYWASQLRAEKCTLSNRSIAKIIACSQKAVEGSIVRLQRGRYIRSLLDDKHHRLEIQPLITMGRRGSLESRTGGYLNKGGSLRSRKKFKKYKTPYPLKYVEGERNIGRIP